MVLALLNRLWHSPTFTSWGNKLAASARLFLVLPLLLKHFDDVQLSAWFLFGSILFFSGVVSNQTSLVLSRMVSVAMGGAQSLGVITADRKTDSMVEPNWNLLERLYGTMAPINLLNGLLGAIVATALGWYALADLVSGYAGEFEIWLSYSIFVLGQLLVQVFARYAISMRGLNQVALSNRWGALFSVLSAGAGGLTLWLGGGMVVLALVMQGFLLLGVLRQWSLLVFVVEPRFRSFARFSFDMNVATMVWEPLWRSFISSVANRGSSRVASILLARNTEPAQLAGVLLVLRLLDTLEDIAVTTMSSHVPRFGRLLAKGDVSQFTRGVLRALRISSLIQAVGILGIGYGVYLLVGWLKTDAVLPGQSMVLVMAFLHLLASQIRQSLMISMVGNHIVAVSRLLVSMGCSIVLSVALIPKFPIPGFIVSSYLPLILVLNIHPLRIGCELMNIKAKAVIRKVALIPWLSAVGGIVLSTCIAWESHCSSILEILKKWQ